MVKVRGGGKDRFSTRQAHVMCFNADKEGRRSGSTSQGIILCEKNNNTHTKSGMDFGPVQQLPTRFRSTPTWVPFGAGHGLETWLGTKNGG